MKSFFLLLALMTGFFSFSQIKLDKKALNDEIGEAFKLYYNGNYNESLRLLEGLQSKIKTYNYLNDNELFLCYTQVLDLRVETLASQFNNYKQSSEIYFKSLAEDIKPYILLNNQIAKYYFKKSLDAMIIYEASYLFSEDSDSSPKFINSSAVTRDHFLELIEEIDNSALKSTHLGEDFKQKFYKMAVRYHETARRMTIVGNYKYKSKLLSENRFLDYFNSFGGSLYKFDLEDLKDLNGEKDEVYYDLFSEYLGILSLLKLDNLRLKIIDEGIVRIPDFSEIKFDSSWSDIEPDDYMNQTYTKEMISNEIKRNKVAFLNFQLRLRRELYYNNFNEENYNEAHKNLDDIGEIIKRIEKTTTKPLNSDRNSLVADRADLNFVQEEYKKALSLLENKDSIVFSSPRAKIYATIKNYDKAISILNNALKLYENTGSKEFDYSKARIQIALGQYNFETKDFQKSKFHYKEAERLSNILKKPQKGDWFNRDVSSLLKFIHLDLAYIYIEEKNKSEGIEYLSKYHSLMSEKLFHSLLWMDIDKRESYFSNHVLSNVFYLVSKLNNSSSEANKIGFNHSLLVKEFLLNTSTALRTNLNLGEFTDLRKLTKDYLRMKELASDVNSKSKDSIFDFIKLYEKELIFRTEESIKELFDNSKMDWKDVQDQLNPKEVAIEFISFSSYSSKNENNHEFYGAYVLKKDWEFPMYVSLFNKKDFAKLINPVFSSNFSLENQINSLYEDNCSKLYEYIWEPLEKHLSGIDKVYYSPTGVLNSISYSALKKSKTQNFLHEQYKLIQLGSTKDILNNNSLEEPKKAALFGDIDYYKKGNPKDYDYQKTSLRGEAFNKLYGTKKEIQDINRIMSSHNIQTLEYSQTNASEENFANAVAYNPDILHVGTHAFYLKPKNQEFSLTELLGRSKFLKEIDPLNRSGLALSGANYFWRFGKKSTNQLEDGILTANEISTMDMSGVDLVVLSACETALGESTNNEGVFGLQRGLKIAGAKHLLLSLWKVDDNITQEYMVDFYTNLIVNKLNIEKAYFKTQQAIKEKYPNPYYWAAFALIR